MEMTYQVLLHPEQLAEIYQRLAREDLLWAVWSDIDADQWSEAFFVSMLSRPEVLVLGGYIDGELAGVMTLNPVIPRTRTAEIGLTAFRRYFLQAEELCRGALLWACDTQDMASVLGRVAAPNRHILRMLGSLGFHEIGRVPDMVWYTRKQKFVDGVLVLATPASIRATVKEEKDMGFGGGVSTPTVEETPEKEPTKSVSAGASAAAEAQQQRARKSRGVASSIMTSRSGVGGMSTNNDLTGGSSTLG